MESPTAAQYAMLASPGIVDHATGRVPETASTACLGLIILMILVLMIAIYYYSKSEECGLGVADAYQSGNNHSQWQNGSLGAGGFSNYQAGDSRPTAGGDGTHTTQVQPTTDYFCGAAASQNVSDQADMHLANFASGNDADNLLTMVKKPSLDNAALEKVMHGQ